MADGTAPVLIGVDVGTGSARAGLFDAKGSMLGAASHDIAMWRDAGGVVEQSSDDIWRAVCASVRMAMEQAGVSADCIVGVGFDATCSLVVLDREAAPLTVSPSQENNRNIIVWMDHRATDQAARINETGHRVLDYVGGRISPEMETPKLLWLKELLPSTFEKAGHFFDLTDYLTWRCTGDLSRSICTVTCKWTYLAHEESWDPDYFRTIGLGTLADEDFARIGQSIVAPGSSLGSGLTSEAAADLGLQAGTPVAAGLIDAHAGGVGTVGASSDKDGGSPVSRMAYVFGTSACTMTSAQEETFVPGVWGPYYSAMVPGLWLAEGGQSAAGEAIAHLIKMHPHAAESARMAEGAGMGMADYLLQQAEKRFASPQQVLDLIGGRLVVPDFLGNRAPLADPSARAVVAGLDTSSDLDSHVALYLAGIAGVGYGLRQILDAQAQNGLKPETVVISGGAGRSTLVKQLLADSANIAIADPASEEPVLLGSAMLGAFAAGLYPSVVDAMAAMSDIEAIHPPTGGATADAHEKAYQRFTALQQAAGS